MSEYTFLGSGLRRGCGAPETTVALQERQCERQRQEQGEGEKEEEQATRTALSPVLLWVLCLMPMELALTEQRMRQRDTRQGAC